MYSGPFTLLTINYLGKLRILYLPIRAICIKATSEIRVGTWVYIEQVKQGSEVPLLYLVFYEWIPHHHFVIKTTF